MVAIVDNDSDTERSVVNISAGKQTLTSSTRRLRSRRFRVAGDRSRLSQASTRAALRLAVLPSVVDSPEVEAPRRFTLNPLRLRRRSMGVFRRRHPTQLTPRDFDLSPYFEVVKFNFIEGRHFDYHRIEWEDDPASDGDDT